MSDCCPLGYLFSILFSIVLHPLGKRELVYVLLMHLFVYFPCVNFQPFLARLYESTGRAIAVTTASALHKMLKFLVKVFKSLYLLNLWMDLVDTLPDVSAGLKFYPVPS